MSMCLYLSLHFQFSCLFFNEDSILFFFIYLFIYLFFWDGVLITPKETYKIPHPNSLQTLGGYT
jgi:hypothetical protein